MCVCSALFSHHSLLLPLARRRAQARPNWSILILRSVAAAAGGTAQIEPESPPFNWGASERCSRAFCFGLASCSANGGHYGAAAAAATFQLTLYCFLDLWPGSAQRGHLLVPLDRSCESGNSISGVASCSRTGTVGPSESAPRKFISPSGIIVSLPLRCWAQCCRMREIAFE